MPKDETKKSSKKRKHNLEKEEMEGIDEKNILPKRLREPRKRFEPPSDDDDDDDENMIRGLVQLLGVQLEELEESENQKYLDRKSVV